MKSKFTTKWQSSRQVRKQRKFRANAPKHIASKFMHAALSKTLRDKHKRRSLRVRSGDEVEILRGNFKGTKGVVDKVDTLKYRVFVRGAEMLKHDGSKRPYPVAVSNVRITKITEDKRRLE